MTGWMKNFQALIKDYDFDLHSGETNLIWFDLLYDTSPDKAAFREGG